MQVKTWIMIMIIPPRKVKSPHSLRSPCYRLSGKKITSEAPGAAPTSPIPPTWTVYFHASRRAFAPSWSPIVPPSPLNTLNWLESRSPPYSPSTWGTSISSAGGRPPSRSMYLCRRKCARVEMGRNGMMFKGRRSASWRIRLVG